ncbi:hypothetical protein [Bifidobacterium sp.]|nr:hypothetical protein [Bifidobacterium sp.]MDY5368328.1 hypothetical protein [Bifidobacterium sp.]
MTTPVQAIETLTAAVADAYLPARLLALVPTAFIASKLPTQVWL